jgi:molybdopterin converting factor small subunit
MRMQVTARYYGFFSTVTRKLYEKIDLADGSAVKDLMDVLAKSYGYKFSRLCFIRPLYSEKDFVNVCLNSLDLNSIQKFPQGLETALKEGDTVSFGVMGGAA